MDQKLQRGTAASRPLVFRQAADATIPGPHPHCEGKNDRCLTTISSEPATSKKAPSVRSSTSYYSSSYFLRSHDDVRRRRFHTDSSARYDRPPGRQGPELRDARMEHCDLDLLQGQRNSVAAYRSSAKR